MSRRKKEPPSPTSVLIWIALIALVAWALWQADPPGPGKLR